MKWFILDNLLLKIIRKFYDFLDKHCLKDLKGDENLITYLSVVEH